MANAEHAAAEKSLLVRFFSAVERTGQKLPDPLTLFFAMGVLVVIVSALFVGTSAEVVQRSGDTVQMEVKSLLTLDGIRWMLLSAVDNFINFAPLGPVLTVMVGIGSPNAPGLSRWACGARHQSPGFPTDCHSGIRRSHEFYGGRCWVCRTHTVRGIAFCQRQAPPVGRTCRCIRRRFGWV